MTADIMAKLEAAQELIQQARALMQLEMWETTCSGRGCLADRLASAFCRLHEIAGEVEAIGAPTEETTA